jgi:hypothetical protein
LYGIGGLLLAAAIAVTCTVILLEDNNGDDDSTSCVTPFGLELGRDSTGIVGYSNCNDEYVSNLDGWAADGTVYSGMKWQCVEYSRRWLITNRNFTYASVDIAVEIWDLPTVTVLNPGLGENTTLPFAQYPTGETAICPEVGCLLIYNTELVSTGHVAVVVGVNASTSIPGNGFISVGEQNLFNERWPHNASARELIMTTDANGLCSLEDDFLIGWKCVL